MANGLWGGVSLAIGLSIGFYFELDEKKILFIAVAAVGLYVLALMRWLKVEEAKKKDPNYSNKGTQNAQKVSSVMVDDGVKERFDSMAVEKNEYKRAASGAKVSDRKTNDDESREWLDEFLIKQQDDD